MRSAFQATAQETTRLRIFFLAQAHAFISEHVFCSEQKQACQGIFLLGGLWRYENDQHRVEITNADYQRVD